MEKQLALKQITRQEAANIIGAESIFPVYRHMKNHVTPLLQEQMRTDEDVANALDVIGALTEAREKALTLFDMALSIEDMTAKVRTALKAIHEDVNVLEAIAKVTGQYGPDTQVNILMDARYIQVKQVIFKALEPYPELREKIADALLEQDEIA